MTQPKPTYERDLNDDFLRLTRLQAARAAIAGDPDAADVALGGACHRMWMEKSLQGEIDQLRRRLASHLEQIERTGTFLA